MFVLIYGVCYINYFYKLYKNKRLPRILKRLFHWASRKRNTEIGLKMTRFMSHYLFLYDSHRMIQLFNRPFIANVTWLEIFLLDWKRNGKIENIFILTGKEIKTGEKVVLVLIEWWINHVLLNERLRDLFGSIINNFASFAKKDGYQNDDYSFTKKTKTKIKKAMRQSADTLLKRREPQLMQVVWFYFSFFLLNRNQKFINQLANLINVGAWMNKSAYVISGLILMKNSTSKRKAISSKLSFLVTASLFIVLFLLLF